MLLHKNVLRVLGSPMGLLVAVFAAWLPMMAHAQFGQPMPPQPKDSPQWAKELSGYWVSLVTENWRLRMVTPSKGDYIGIPLNKDAQKIADGWDPQKDEASGQACRGYSAALIMSRPERLHITWQDPSTLQMEIDAGEQTRTFHFGGTVPAAFQPTWQGYSVAIWHPRHTPNYGRTPLEARYLEATTTHLLPGYVRQNGVPYGANAVVKEAYDLITVSDKEKYLTITQWVTDPQYLDYPYVLSEIFRKQPTDAGWNPTPCSASW
jgi:hypothetical protein